MPRFRPPFLVFLLSLALLSISTVPALAQTAGPSPALAPAAPPPDVETAPAQSSPGAAPASDATPPPAESPPAPAPPSPEAASAQPAPATLPVVEVPKRPRKKRKPFPAQVGLRGSASGVLAEDTSVFGFAGQLRYRPSRRVAFDFGAGFYRGKMTSPEITFDRRREIPVSAEFAFFIKSSGLLQLYLLTGPFVTFADNRDTRYEVGNTREDVYVGHTFGLGLEVRLGKHVGVHGELRGFVRERVDDGDGGPPEYQELDGGRPTGNGTETMAGGLLTLGASLYF